MGPYGSYPGLGTGGLAGLYGLNGMNPSAYKHGHHKLKRMHGMHGLQGYNPYAQFGKNGILNPMMLSHMAAMKAMAGSREPTINIHDELMAARGPQQEESSEEEAEKKKGTERTLWNSMERIGPWHYKRYEHA